jgi:hypothetical protein
MDSEKADLIGVGRRMVVTRAGSIVGTRTERLTGGN